MPLGITDVQNCANFFQKEYIDKIYKIETLNQNTFWLSSEKSNFPHLIGIKRNTFQRIYSKAEDLFDDIIKGNTIDRRIIPTSIQPSSLKGKKILNFNKSILLFKSPETLCIQYNPSKNTLKLNNVTILLSNFQNGYSMGWTFNRIDNILNVEHAHVFCPSSWIDESGGTLQDKEKYYNTQESELLKKITIYDKYGTIIETIIPKYTISRIKSILLVLERNNINLLQKDKLIKFLFIAKIFRIKIKLNNILC